MATSNDPISLLSESRNSSFGAVRQPQDLTNALNEFALFSRMGQLPSSNFHQQFEDPFVRSAPEVKERPFVGVVTKLNETFGFIDEQVFFQTSCVRGLMPRQGDRVLVEAVFNPCKPFKWNATRIQTIPKVETLATARETPSRTRFAPYNAVAPPTNIFQRPVDRPSKVQKTEEKLGAEKTSLGRRKRLRGPRKRNRSLHLSHSASPVAKRVARYVVQIPKVSLLCKEVNVAELKQRYANLYIPSDFVQARLSWSDAFPVQTPLSLDTPCPFYIVPKGREKISDQGTLSEPNDVDYTFSAKVMLLSAPAMKEMYEKSCSLAGDTSDVFVHPTRLLQFLVGTGEKNETMSIGGPWSPSVDGKDPVGDPQVLIRTAIRTCRTLTGVDLSSCACWFRFLEVMYTRDKGKDDSRIETVVIFLPDVWSCLATQQEWDDLHVKSGSSSMSALEENLEELNDRSPSNDEATHIDELDEELESNGLNGNLSAADKHSETASMEVQTSEHEILEVPSSPHVIVNPLRSAKRGKFDCKVMSLSLILDYRQEDSKEHSFEVSLFAEAFNEMLTRDFGYKMYRTLVDSPDAQGINPMERRKCKSKANGVCSDGKDDKGGKKNNNSTESKESPTTSSNDDANKQQTEPIVTDNPALLLACVYFDENHCGYILGKDLEDIFYMLAPSLSRKQVQFIVQKAVGKDSNRFYYRKWTDVPQSEVRVQDNEQTGNSKGRQNNSVEQEIMEGLENGTQSSCDGIVKSCCSIVDVDKLFAAFKRNERARVAAETMLVERTSEKELAVKMLKDSEVKVQQLGDELQKALSEKSEVEQRLEILQNRTDKMLRGLKVVHEKVKGVLEEAQDVVLKVETI